jgi:hypothetical protein
MSPATAVILTCIKPKPIKYLSRTIFDSPGPRLSIVPFFTLSNILIPNGPPRTYISHSIFVILSPPLFTIVACNPIRLL